MFWIDGFIYLLEKVLASPYLNLGVVVPRSAYMKLNSANELSIVGINEISKEAPSVLEIEKIKDDHYSICTVHVIETSFLFDKVTIR